MASTQLHEEKGERAPVWQAAFLAALKTHGNATRAALQAGIDRKTAYNRRNSNPEFAEAWEEALDAAGDELEEEARKRAMGGSDVLLIFLLKGAKPEKYKERREDQHKFPAGSKFTMEIGGPPAAEAGASDGTE